MLVLQLGDGDAELVLFLLKLGNILGNLREKKKNSNQSIKKQTE